MASETAGPARDAPATRPPIRRRRLRRSGVDSPSLALRAPQDFYPEEMRRQRPPVRPLPRGGRARAFAEYDAPVLERQELPRGGWRRISAALGEPFGDKEQRAALRAHPFASAHGARARAAMLPLKWFSVPHERSASRSGDGSGALPVEHGHRRLRLRQAEVELLSAVTTFFAKIGIRCRPDRHQGQLAQGHGGAFWRAMGVGDDKFAPVCVVMDKFDKIGADAVIAELGESRGICRSAEENRRLPF